ncbi:hypothetical protein G7Y89_g12910 [Cudoniella acicularis]|uniref:DNA-directed DNA polymerase n=1 Tax=Cudoniella acicularis TaxID=354080 RepID=A0A8H4VZ73_9HELO|nr:hypothetical protein G7Y89_g12910 [Cudoniella acicularis]
MAAPQDGASSSRPLPVPMSSSPGSFRGRSSGSPVPRAASTARLASPVPSHTIGTPPVRQIPTPNQVGNDAHQPGSLTPLAGPAPHSSLPGPGISALAAALSDSFGHTPPKFGTPPLRPLSPSTAAHQIHHTSGSGSQSNYGSFDARGRSVQGGTGWAGPNAYEDPEIVKRHLVQPSETTQSTDTHQDGIFGQPMSLRGGSPAGKAKQASDHVAPGLDDDEFSSLRLQGGDITRPIYKWTEEAQARAHGRGKGQRSMSFNLSRPYPEDETLNIESIKVPGGFRRNFLRRAAGSPGPESEDGVDSEEGVGLASRRRQGPKMLTNNFIEFLTIYGHFAGEELEEDDEVLEPDEYFSSDLFEAGEEGSESEREPMEDSALLTPGRRKRKRKDRHVAGTIGPTGALLLLLKSFVGTGVLFLPKAYLNGGMLFSNLVLVFVAALSYYCFVLLVNTRLKVDGSFGDIGGILYGRWMRNTILFSIVISQIGFVAAYIVFTSENLQAFILAVSNCKTHIDIQWLILMQMAIFLPFSLLRDISKLGFTALIADLFILIGLIYLYYYDILTIVNQHGVADIVNFNPKDWTLFIGTAIFTFEGIGLIIPIQESMKNPKKFPGVLALMMIIISVVFISMGALSYAAYGSATETVVILNMPQDSKVVNGVQFLYSVAILLSTPLQIFPAIRITENELFTRSGKYNPFIKWQKNVFRFFVVMLCAAIAWIGANDLDKFVSVVGSFACVPLVYIYPQQMKLQAFVFTKSVVISLIINFPESHGSVVLEKEGTIKWSVRLLYAKTARRLPQRVNPSLNHHLKVLDIHQHCSQYGHLRGAWKFASYAFVSPANTALEIIIDLPHSDQKYTSLERVSNSYKPLETYALAKEKHYQQQYGDMYFLRLTKLKPAVEKIAEDAWDGFQIAGETVQKMERVLDVRQGKLCWVTGTIYMEMPLKPNILDDISKDHWISAPPARQKYLSPSGEDLIMLEDESGRLRLIGAPLSHEMLVTGCIIAVMGTENANGDFEVVDMKVPDLPPQPERWKSSELPAAKNIKDEDEDEDMEMPTLVSNGKKIAIISGLEFSGTNAEYSLEINLLTEFLLGEALDPVTQQNVSHISRLIIAGNSIAQDGEAASHDTIGNTKKAAHKKYGYDSSAYNPAPIVHFDDFLATLLPSLPITLLPGYTDPANVSLPQQPIHPAMFPQARAFGPMPAVGAEAKQPGWFDTVTNPWDGEVEGWKVLGTGGQNVDDVFKYVESEDRLGMMEAMCRWRCCAPTAPDTLLKTISYKRSGYLKRSLEG